MASVVTSDVEASTKPPPNVDEDSAKLLVCNRSREYQNWLQISFNPFRRCNKCKYPIVYLDDPTIIPCNQCKFGYKSLHMCFACNRVRINHVDSEGKTTLDRTPTGEINKHIEKHTIVRKRKKDNDFCTFKSEDRLPTRLTRELPKSQQESANIFSYCPASSTPRPPIEAII